MGTLELAVRGVGALISVVGVGVCLYWYVFWNRNYEGRLITHGPYAYVRHPFYSGFLSLAVGLTLLLPGYETRILLTMTLAVIVAYVPREEEALLKQYRKKYSDYMEKVRHRLIPGVY